MLQVVSLEKHICLKIKKMRSQNLPNSFNLRKFISNLAELEYFVNSELPKRGITKIIGIKWNKTNDLPSLRI